MKHFKFTKQTITIAFSILCLILLSLLISLINNKPVVYSDTDFYFDTVISISIYDKSKTEAKDLIDNCFLQCQRYENLFSRTLPNSEIYLVNHSNNLPTNVDREVIDLVQKAMQYSDASNETVTPLIGNLSSLWDFDSPNFSFPTNEEISYALSHINSSNLQINENNSTITLLDPDCSLDLGFIAKGYISDKLKEYLIANGVTSAIINLGGNVLCIGQKPDNTCFNIGIKDPKNPTSNILLSIPVNDKSVISSGDYERNIIIDGQLYHHILSTKNGYPVSSGLSQVTIISDSATEGDALSTICFILGFDKANVFLSKNYPNVKAIFVDNNGNIIE